MNTQVLYTRLVEVVQKLSLARDMVTVTTIVKSATRELAGADGATFILRKGDMCSYVDEDAISPLWKGKSFPMANCVSGWVMINKTATVIPDIYNDERVPVEAYRPTFVKSMAMIPVRKEQPIGAVGVYWASSHICSDTELDILQSLADITAVTVENITLYNELESRVKQRTADLETFTYAVTHDIQTPLRHLNLSTDILQQEYKKSLDDRGQQLLTKVWAKTNEMSSLVSSLMNLFTLSKKDFSETMVPMKKMAETIAMEFLEHEKDRTIELDIQNIPSIPGDEVLLRQVWANLIGNAVKYTRTSPHAKIQVSSELIEGKIVYCVEDNGAGFDMMYYDKLFTPFQRLHKHNEFEGAGLGLSMVEKIIDRHNGKIWAQSSIGKGSTFFFSLPAAK